ncbi:MAG: SpoIIE family protein phosphatase, partial [Acidimicrobiales bacterium]|nr:SpoIIE family protein phosphatase [Acidimicrobiales bacterium]
LKLRALMCVPLQARRDEPAGDSRARGVLYVDSKAATREFTQQDLRYFTALSQQIAVALESARLHLDSLMRTRLEQSLELASAIQRGLMPQVPDDVPGYELFGWYLSAERTSGDFYDFVRTRRGHYGVVVGDVTGHGIEPSITAFQAKYLLRVFLRQYRDPAQALEELNAQMAAMGRPEELISLCVIVFDTEAGTLRFASAGHPAAWLWHDREVRPLRSTGPLLMLDPGASYHSREIPLDNGDLCLLYTDGLAEARDGESLFGEDRIANTLRRDPGIAPDVLCKSLLEAARDFSSGPITDDVAILAIRRE